MAYPARGTLGIRQWQRESCAVVEVAGELDMTAVPLLRAELAGVIEASRPPRLVLDLTRTTFCDSLGLGLLVSTYNTMRETDGRLALAVAPGMIARLLTITNLDRHFEIFATAEDAVAGASRAA